MKLAKRESHTMSENEGDPATPIESIDKSGEVEHLTT